MDKTPLFQDLLADFSDDMFVGRIEYLTLFDKALVANRPPFLILAISGQGGVGKTTLLEKFRRSTEALTAKVDEFQMSLPDTLFQIATQFREAGEVLETLEERHRKYLEINEQVKLDPNAPKGMQDFILRSTTRIGLRSLHKLPIGGSIVDVLLPSEFENRIVEEVSSFLTQKFKNKEERVLLTDTNAILTQSFVQDLGKISSRNRIVLMFDTYELTFPILEVWLMDLLAGKFGQFPGTVRFVIAGRHPLSQDWTRYQGAIEQVELSEFTESEARDYLTKNNITDEIEIAELLRLSDQMPVLLEFLVTTPKGVFKEVCDTAVDRFLQGTTAEQREMALSASVPRFFDEDVLTVLIGEKNASIAFAWLKTAHFVRLKAPGWTIHEVVRKILLRYFRLRSETTCLAIHEKMSAYYTQKMERMGIKEEKARNNAQWRTLEQEQLYHRLSLKPSESINKVISTFVKNVAYDYDQTSVELFESMHIPLTQTAATIKQVATEVNVSEFEKWSEKLELTQSYFAKGTSEYSATIILSG